MKSKRSLYFMVGERYTPDFSYRSMNEGVTKARLISYFPSSLDCKLISAFCVVYVCKMLVYIVGEMPLDLQQLNTLHLHQVGDLFQQLFLSHARLQILGEQVGLDGIVINGNHIIYEQLLAIEWFVCLEEFLSLLLRLEFDEGVWFLVALVEILVDLNALHVPESQQVLLQVMLETFKRFCVLNILDVEGRSFGWVLGLLENLKSINIFV